MTSEFFYSKVNSKLTEIMSVLCNVYDFLNAPYLDIVRD